MKNEKSEKWKKLEAELRDLEKWEELGFVPEKDYKKHKEEIALLKIKIDEERERLEDLRNSNPAENYEAPRRSSIPKKTYPENTIVPDAESYGNTNLGSETEPGRFFTSYGNTDPLDEKKTSIGTSFDEEDPFSDKKRWERGAMENNSQDEW